MPRAPKWTRTTDNFLPLKMLLNLRCNLRHSALTSLGLRTDASCTAQLAPPASTSVLVSDFSGGVLLKRRFGWVVRFDWGVTSGSFAAAGSWALMLLMQLSQGRLQPSLQLCRNVGSAAALAVYDLEMAHQSRHSR